MSARYPGLAARIALAEKATYPWANHRHAGAGGCALWCGCGFASHFPRTTERLVALMGEVGIGVVHDCCGAALSEARDARADEVIARLARRLDDDGVRELVVVCPNCARKLARIEGVTVTPIYRKLTELGLGGQVERPGEVFVPCPDRARGEWLRLVEGFLPRGCTVPAGLKCCGLAGWAQAKGRDYRLELARAVLESAGAGRPVLTYCASCAGNLARADAALRKADPGRPAVEVLHVLPLILGVDEVPATGATLLNRAKLKFT